MGAGIHANLTALTRCASVSPQLRTVSYSAASRVPMTVGSSLLREKLAPSRAKCRMGWSCTRPTGTAFVRMEDYKKFKGFILKFQHGVME